MCIVPFELVKKMYGFHDGETSGGQYRGFLRPCDKRILNIKINFKFLW